MNRSQVCFSKFPRRFAALTLPLVLCVFGFGSMASASTLVISGGGTFSSNTPVSSYSAPGGTFSFSFDVDSNPAVSMVNEGSYFKTSLTNVSYVLNGASMSTTGSDALFYSDALGGPLNICLTADCTTGFNFEGPQVYTGSETSPTIMTGSYLSIEGSFYKPQGYELASMERVTISQAAATPEPSSLVLLGTGVLGVAGVVRRRLQR